MKRFDLGSIDVSDISLRLLANIADVFVIYTVFALVRWYLYKPISIHIAYFLVFVAIAAVAVRLIEKRGMAEKRERTAVIVMGAAMSLAFAVLTSMSYGVMDMAVVFIMFLILWGRAVKSTFTDLYGIFNVESFYWGIAIIAASDSMIYMLKLMDRQKNAVSSCVLLYIVISLYLLSTLKTRIFNSGNQEQRKTSFDLLATLATLLISLVFSSSGAMHAVMVALGYVHRLIVYLVGIIAIPLGYVAVFLLDKVRFLFEAMWQAQTSDPKSQYEDAEQLNEVVRYASVDRFIHFVAYVLLAIAVIAVIYYIYRAMDKYMGKNRAKDYEESREFVLGLGQLRENLPKGLGVLKNLYNAAVDRLLFNIKATTGEKIRYEYKKFIRLLYSKELVSEEHTAADICRIIEERYPKITGFIADATKMYEDIRYGAKEPSKDELGFFKECLDKVIDVVE